MSVLGSFRNYAGVVLRDWPRYHRALCQPVSTAGGIPQGWSSLCNRIETLTPNPSGPGVRCEWKWGSDLHACLVMPTLGRRLLRVALDDWPIRFADVASSRSGPRVSFLFAHSGRDRIKQLCRTIRSIFAQTDVQVECIIVGQSPSPVEGDLPDGIIYRHLNKEHVPEGWYKSWAYNVGARLATGEIFVFQDGDVCVPERYASELARTILQDGYHVASLQRFLFYLDAATTRRIEHEDEIIPDCVPERIYQNWKGGTIAVRRDTFFKLGGFDEGFVDWGGEDDEFYDRCSIVRHCRYGFLPFVHLWHSPQRDRRAIDNPNITKILPHRTNIPPTERIAELTHRRFGNWQAPDPLQSYKSMLTSSRHNSAY